MPRRKPLLRTNRILSGLSPGDRALLEPHLEPIDLPLRKRLHQPNKRVKEVYFILEGLASVVANGDHPIEVGMIGREGMTGIATVLNSDERVPYETYMQVGGSGRCLPKHRLRAALEQSPTLHAALLRYAHAFMAQTTQTALANGRNTIIERLARWLLMVDDRVDGSDLPLTHDLLGVMLGTARPGVTLALHELERRGWIAHSRGVISILDRKGLEKASGSAYVPPAER